MSVIEFHRSHSGADATTVRDVVDAEVESTSPAPRSSVEFVRGRPPAGDTRTARGREDGNSAAAFALPAELGAALRHALDLADASASRFVIVAMPPDSGPSRRPTAEQCCRVQAEGCDDVVRERLAGILAADMAGYTRLMAADERGTVAALEVARLVFRACIEAHAGRVVDMAGDSVLATFETATGALRAALAAQARLRANAGSVAEHRRVQFRIGVHVGDIIEKADGTVYGDGINIAARLQALAHPADVLVSDSARGAIGCRVAASYEARGRHRVKDAGRTVVAYRAVDAASGASGSLTAN